MPGRVPYQKTLANVLQCEGATKTYRHKADALEIVAATFPAGIKPVLTLLSRVATTDWTVDLSGPGTGRKANQAELRHFLRPTRFLPTDGLVKDTANQITRPR